jgi:hypothetical protein
VVQLGDLGAYAAKPGSRACFALASDFLRCWRLSPVFLSHDPLRAHASPPPSGFAPLPHSLVTGNHDLEGFDDFATDAENLAAWRQQFGTHHHWAVRAGAYLLVGLSTVRFRDAPGSCHEVYIDPEQMAWFEATLAANRGTPTLVFSHAPPMGCGLRVLQAVHVKNRCAWLNHGGEPARFAEIAASNPQIKLWFSGHFHLSHDYKDSVSVRGECAFVQVGVIGATSSRDGRRHSRLLRASAEGYSLYTVDHNAGGALRLDMRRSFADTAAPQPLPPPVASEIACDPAAGWLCAVDECTLDGPRAQWFHTGTGELAVQQNALVEYEARTRSPLGLVARTVDGRTVRLVGADGAPAAGTSAVAVELVAADGAVERIARGVNGFFFQTFQENKYQKWLRAQKEKAEAAAAAV